MSLPQATPAYSQADQNRTRAQLDRMDGANRKKGQDIELTTDRLILTSDGGFKFAVVVDDAGNLSTEAA